MEIYEFSLDGRDVAVLPKVLRARRCNSFPYSIKEINWLDIDGCGELGCCRFGINLSWNTFSTFISYPLISVSVSDPES